MPLGGFSLSLLLVLSRIPRFEEPVIGAIVHAFQKALQMRQWCASSPWLRLATARLPSLLPEELLAKTVLAAASAGYEQGIQSLVRLASSFVDAPLPAAQCARAAAAFSAAFSADGGGEQRGAEVERLPVATRMVLLGQRTLLDIFRQHSQVRGEVLDSVLSRIVSRVPAVHQWVGFLRQLVQAQPVRRRRRFEPRPSPRPQRCGVDPLPSSGDG